MALWVFVDMGQIPAGERLKDQVEKIYPSLVEIRRDLHMHPELGFSEARTAKIIAGVLRELGLEVQTGLAGTGVLGILAGARVGRTIAIRADMDALSICEEGEGKPYASQTPGVMHACGHDGHTTVVLGIAKLLASHRERLQGCVKFIFQPGEERPKVLGPPAESLYRESVNAVTGATLMIEAGVLEDPKVDAIIGLHLWPDLPVGTIGVQYGATMAGVGNFHIIVRGKSSHAAKPQHGIDAIAAAAQWITLAQLLVSRFNPPERALVLNVGTIQGGCRRNVIADRVDMTGTIRSYDPELLHSELPARLQKMLQGVTEAMGATYEFHYNPLIGPVVNEPVITRQVKESIRRILGPDKVVVLQEPAMVSEDFAFYLNEVPGTHIKIGCANPSKGFVFPLHSSRFDFDERALAWGVLALGQATLDLLESD